MKDSSNSKEPRRKFLNRGVAAGFGLAVLATSTHLGGKNKKAPKMIRAITADGKVFEIEEKYMMKMCSGRISNDRLKHFIENERNLESS